MYITKTDGILSFMDVRNRELVFTVPETATITAILSTFLSESREGLEPEEELVLRRIWGVTSDISIGSLTQKFIGFRHRDIEDNLEKHLEADKQGGFITGDTKYIAGVLEGNSFVVEDGDIILKAFDWARNNLVHGSRFIQNSIGRDLNSSYEDIPLVSTIGSTNASMSEYAATSLIFAGTQAGIWCDQIN